MTLLEHIGQEPLWLQIWVNWMVFINLFGIVFIWSRVEPRWVVAAFLCSAIFMNFLFSLHGYQKILGASHIIFWTPLLVYLFLRRYEIGRYGASAVYLGVVFATDFISLIIDFSDVARFVIDGPQYSGRAARASTQMIIVFLFN